VQLLVGGARRPRGLDVLVGDPVTALGDGARDGEQSPQLR
jgi:hypothetical protein